MTHLRIAHSDPPAREVPVRVADPRDPPFLVRPLSLTAAERRLHERVLAGLRVTAATYMYR